VGKSSGLGKGLSALIPQDVFAEEEQSASSVVVLPIAVIEPNPEQPRKQFDETALNELAESIRKHGVIQPIIVEKSGSTYKIVAGERRWRASKIAGLSEIPALVREYGREKRLEIALIENIQRENLNPVDEAEAYRQIIEITNITQDELAERVGKSRPAVANSLRLLNLPEFAKEALRNGMITAGHARAVLSVVENSKREEILHKIIQEGLSVREAEQLAGSLNGGKIAKHSEGSNKNSDRTDADLERIRQQLIEKLGTRVVIKGSQKKGVISLEYYSLDDLNRLYSLLCGDDTI